MDGSHGLTTGRQRFSAAQDPHRRLTLRSFAIPTVLHFDWTPDSPLLLSHMRSVLPERLQHLLLAKDPSTGRIVNLGEVDTKSKRAQASPDPSNLHLSSYTLSPLAGSHPVDSRDAKPISDPTPPSPPHHSKKGLGLWTEADGSALAGTSPLFTYNPLARPDGSSFETKGHFHDILGRSVPTHTFNREHAHSDPTTPPSLPFTADGGRSFLPPVGVAPTPGSHAIPPSPQLTDGVSPRFRPHQTSSPLHLHRSLKHLQITADETKANPPGTAASRSIQSQRRLNELSSPGSRYPLHAPHGKLPLARSMNSSAGILNREPPRLHFEHRAASWPGFSSQMHDTTCPAGGTTSAGTPASTLPRRPPKLPALSSPDTTRADARGKEKASTMRRTSMACDRCRTHKVGCKIDLALGVNDGSCGRCVRSGAQCSYYKPRKKRGPAPRARI